VLLSVIIALIAIPGATLPHRVETHGITQVWVPAGCFKMGSDPTKDPNATYIQQQTVHSEQPAHRVCLTHGYWIDKYDVTNAAFDGFVKADGYSTDAYWSEDGLRWKQTNNVNGPQANCTSISSAPQQPRVCVSYYEAQAYANWRTQTDKDGLLYRLPTESEWEYAARGPLNWIYPWGNTFDSNKANTFETGPHKTTNVGSYPAGIAWVGAQDMVGNVSQWIADWYDESYYQNSPTNDPVGPSIGDYRVLRGGSWYTLQGDARSASRDKMWPAVPLIYGNSAVGFRLVGIAFTG